MIENKDKNSDTPLHDKSAGWLLQNRRSIVEMLAAMRIEQDDEYDWYVEWQGIQPDEADRAVDMLMAGGFNLDAWFREMGLLRPQPQPQQRTMEKMSEEEIFLTLFNHIVCHRIDITAERKDWLIIGAVLRTNFGDEAGLEMFLSISQFYPTFTEREARQTFKSCRASGYGFAPFYNVCKRNGIYIKDVVFNK